MIAYFDTSAVVPLVIAEASSAAAKEAWDSASRVVGIPILYTEARAALASARRAKRLTSAELRGAVAELETYYDDIALATIDDELARIGGNLAEQHALRGYDAIHLAAARRLHDDDVVFVAGDDRLLMAATAEGLAVNAL